MEDKDEDKDEDEEEEEEEEEEAAAPGAWLHRGSAPALVTIWGVNQKILSL